MQWKELLLVAFGGGAGAVARYLTQKVFSSQLPGAFPAGTFIVNIAGCLLIGILLGLSLKYSSFSLQLKLLLMTGFCGGFTTFSSFTAESLALLQQQRTGIFLLYTGLSVVAGIFATFLGFTLSR